MSDYKINMRYVR